MLNLPAVPAERSMRESEERYRTIFDLSPHGMLVIAMDGSFLDFNERAASLLGYTREEMKRLTVPDIEAVESPDQVARHLAEIVARGSDDFETRHRAKDGRILDVRVRARLIELQGKTCFLSVWEDITERKRTAQELIRSEARYRALYDRTRDGIVAVTLDGRIQHANRAYCDMLGFALEELQQMTYQQLTPARWYEAEAAIVRDRIIAEGDSGEYEKEYIRKDGSVFPVSIRAWPVHDTDGRVVGIEGNVRDIAERKKAGHALRAAHATFRHLVEESPFGIYAVDADFRLVEVSAGARKVFQNIDPLLGRDCADVLRTIWTEPFASEAIRRFRHTLATGEPYRSPATVERRKDIPETEAYDWKVEQVMLPDGRPGVVCHFYDLSEQHRQHEHIQYLMRELNHRTKNMLSLVQVIAHQTAAKGGDFLGRFTDRLMSLAASQDLLVKSVRSGIAIEALVRSQLAHFAEAIDNRIVLDGPPLHLNAHASQPIGMALHELATNASKYGALSTPEGRVEIAWQVVPHARGARLQLGWRELDGPPVSKPSRRGFGSNVIESIPRLQLDADVILEFAPAGIVWQLACPVASALEMPSDAPPPGAPCPLNPGP